MQHGNLLQRHVRSEGFAAKVMRVRAYITCTSSATATTIATARSSRPILLGSLRLACTEDSRVDVVEDPEEADIVLFVESSGDEPERDDALQRVVRDPVYRRFKQKAVVYSAKDLPRPLVPGLYPSIPRRWASLLGCQGAPYLVEGNPFLEQALPAALEAGPLASFQGVCRSFPLRMRLVREAQRRGWSDVVVRDTSAAFLATLRSGDVAGHNALKELFVRRMLEAKFALCPRGNGPSSFRIFEAMQLGRAPVVLADEWTPPP